MSLNQKCNNKHNSIPLRCTSHRWITISNSSVKTLKVYTHHNSNSSIQAISQYTEWSHLKIDLDSSVKRICINRCHTLVLVKVQLQWKCMPHLVVKAAFQLAECTISQTKITGKIKDLERNRFHHHQYSTQDKILIIFRVLVDSLSLLTFSLKCNNSRVITPNSQ
jgi:hypothetical protein